MTPRAHRFRVQGTRHHHRDCINYADPSAADAICARTCRMVNGASKGCLYGKKRYEREDGQ